MSSSLTNALQVRDLAAQPPQEGDKPSVIYGNEHNDGQRVEDCKAGCRNVEFLSAAPVHNAIHDCALLHKEAAHLLPEQTGQRLEAGLPAAHHTHLHLLLCLCTNTLP